MSSTTHAPAETDPAPSTDASRRGRIIVLILLALVLIGSGLWWVISRAGSVDVVDVRPIGALGVSVEVDYAPLLPTTVTGGRVFTDAGSADGSLYDNSTDDDVPPQSVEVRLGRSVSLSFVFVPDCRVSTTSSEATITVQTSSGDRVIESEVAGLGESIHRWCNSHVWFDPTSATRDGQELGTTYRVSTPTRDPVRVSVRDGVYKARPIIVSPGDQPVSWEITTDGGCDQDADVVAVLTYSDGRQGTVRLPSFGNGVC